MKNSTLTYILSSTAVMQFKDDDYKFIEKSQHRISSDDIPVIGELRIGVR